MPEMNMVQALNLALMQEMKNDKSVIVMGEDVGVNGGVFRVTDNLLKKFGNQRVLDTPLAEAGIIGTATGMAIYGLKPVTELQFSGFIYPAFQQIISHVSRFRNRTRGRFTCPMVIRAPYSGGIRALEHHSESMEALYAHIPGLKVVIPSTPYDAKGLLISAIRDPDPVLFLEPKSVYRAIKQEVPTKEYTIPLGKANIVQEGEDITIISYGAMMKLVNKISHRLADIKPEIIDLRTISPLDIETIIKSVQKTKRCIIVHEGPKRFGVAAEITTTLTEKLFDKLEAPIERVTGFSTIIPLYKTEKEYLPNEKRLVNAITKIINYKKE